MLQTEGYIQALLANQQVLFLLGDPKKMLETLRITSLNIKTVLLKFQNTSSLCDGEVALPVVHVGPSHQAGLVNP